jgi:hypothetical protein
MRLELVILEQPMLGAPTDIVARDKLHRSPTDGAKTRVVLCHQCTPPSWEP